MGLFAPDRMAVEEALSQMKDEALMQAAMLAYKHAEVHRDCECATMIGDDIRKLLRPQR